MDKRKRKNIIWGVIVSLLCVIMLVVIIVLIVNAVQSAERNNNYASECLQGEDVGEIMNCLDDKAYSYYLENNCEEALKVYDDIPTERFDDVSLDTIYDDAYSLSLSCDEQFQNYWKVKKDEISNRIGGRS